MNGFCLFGRMQARGSRSSCSAFSFHAVFPRHSTASKDQVVMLLCLGLVFVFAIVTALNYRP